MNEARYAKDSQRFHLASSAALLLRFSVGIIFIFHGWPKLAHPQQWAGAFLHMGFPGFFAQIAGLLEVVGGVLLLFGLFTRLAASLLAIEMMIAVGRVDLPSGPVWRVDNYELSLLLAATAFALVANGPGSLSFDFLWIQNFKQKRMAVEQPKIG